MNPNDAHESSCLAGSKFPSSRISRFALALSLSLSLSLVTSFPVPVATTAAAATASCLYVCTYRETGSGTSSTDFAASTVGHADLSTRDCGTFANHSHRLLTAAATMMRRRRKAPGGGVVVVGVAVAVGGTWRTASELLLWSVVLVHRVVESVDRAWLVGRRHWRGKRWRTHSGQRLLLGKRVLV